MSDDLSRRQFVKLATALGASLALPASVLAGCGPESIVITDIQIDSAMLGDAMTLGDVHLGPGNQGTICVSLDRNKVWRAVTAIDGRGRRWTTADGQTWRHGHLSFQAEEWEA